MSIKRVNWAGQICDVLEETADKFLIRFSNASGTCEMWLGKAANLHRVMGYTAHEVQVLLGWRYPNQWNEIDGYVQGPDNPDDYFSKMKNTAELFEDYEQWQNTR